MQKRSHLVIIVKSLSRAHFGAFNIENENVVGKVQTFALAFPHNLYMKLLPQTMELKAYIGL